MATAVVLPSSVSVELRVTSSDGAVLSVDGYLNLPVEKGSGVRIQRSERKAKFLRETEQQGVLRESDAAVGV